MPYRVTATVTIRIEKSQVFPTLGNGGSDRPGAVVEQSVVREASGPNERYCYPEAEDAIDEARNTVLQGAGGVAMTRSPFPALIQNAPSCPVCYASVSFDGDGWACKTCHVTWSSDAYDVDGQADEDRDQCSAEVMPYRDREDVPNLRGDRYRCVRDADHPIGGPFEYHVGARSDGGIDYDGHPLEWRDGEYPQWQPEPAEVTS